MSFIKSQKGTKSLQNSLIKEKTTTINFFTKLGDQSMLEPLALQTKQLLPDLLVKKSQKYISKQIDTSGMIQVSIQDFNVEVEKQFTQNFKNMKAQNQIICENDIANKLVKKSRQLFARMDLKKAREKLMTPVQPKINILMNTTDFDLRKTQNVHTGSTQKTDYDHTTDSSSESSSMNESRSTKKKRTMTMNIQELNAVDTINLQNKLMENYQNSLVERSTQLFTVEDQRSSSLSKKKTELIKMISRSYSHGNKLSQQKFTVKKLNQMEIPKSRLKLRQLEIDLQRQDGEPSNNLENEKIENPIDKILKMQLQQRPSNSSKNTDYSKVANSDIKNRSQLPPKPSGFSKQNTMNNPQRRLSKIVDKSILRKNTYLDQEKLAKTLDHLQKDFFSCPLVDEPDPQEKMLMVYQQKEVEDYLKQERQKREQVNQLTIQLEQVERKMSIIQMQQKINGTQTGISGKLELLQNNALLRKISDQLLQKTQARAINNIRKLRGFQQKKPNYINEEIRNIDDNDKKKGKLIFQLLSPKDYSTKDIVKKNQKLKDFQKEVDPRVEQKRLQIQYVSYQEKLVDIMETTGKQQIEEEKKKKQEDMSPTEQLKRKKQLFIKCLITSTQEMKQMKVTPEMIMDGLVFPNIPYKKGLISREFYHAAKIGDSDTIRMMLKRDRFLVYEYDYCHQTALHWAAKRDKSEVIKLLIQAGARINQRDMGGRTPLLLAAKYSNLRAVKALLAGKANPNVRTFSGTTPIMVTEDHKVKGFLSKAILLHICMPLINVRRRQAVWELEGLAYFDSPDQFQISDFA